MIGVVKTTTMKNYNKQEKEIKFEYKKKTIIIIVFGNLLNKLSYEQFRKKELDEQKQYNN